ncbi:MAG: hypothetical protein KA113_14140 [Syntrophaceae bacterium]|nr:hypothetical protein [Syntrophaceae bacterium]
MKRNGVKGLLIFLAAAVFGLAGCAAPGIYSVNMDYDAQRAAIPSYLKPDQKALQAIISVAEFSDVRKISDPLVIGRVIEKNGVKVLVLPKTTKPTEAVAQGVRAYLRRAGFNVSGILDRWDLHEQTILQPPNSRLLIGGAIEGLEVDCRRAFPTNTYATKIRLTLYLADTAQKKILYRSTVEATTSLEHALFSEERLGEQASVALGDAIEKLFEKHELSQQMSQLLSR